MPTKLLTLVCGVAGGFGIALAVSAAADRGIEHGRQTERRQNEMSRDDDRRTDDFRSEFDGPRGQISGRGRGERAQDVHNDRTRHELADRGSHGREFDRGHRFEGDGPGHWGGHPPVRPVADRGGWERSHDRSRGGFSEHHSWHGRHHSGGHAFAGYHRHRHGHQGEFSGHRFAHHGRHGPGHHYSWQGRHHFGGHAVAGLHHHRHGHHGGFGGHRFAHHGHHRFGHHHTWYGRHHMGRHQFGSAGRFGFGMSHFAGRHGGPRLLLGQGMMHGNVMPQRGTFSSFDLDGDGKITKEEVLKMYATVDKDGDGSVTREDFIKAMIAGSKANVTPEKATAPHAAKEVGPSQDNRRHSDGARRQDVPIPGRHGGGRFGASGPNHPGFFGPPAASMLMSRFDKEQKGKLTKDDVPAPLWDRISKADANGDGSVTKDELETYFKNRRPGAPDAGSTAKPDQKRDNTQLRRDEEKPKEQKPDEAKPQAQLTEPDKPADATSAANVTVTS